MRRSVLLRCFAQYNGTKKRRKPKKTKKRRISVRRSGLSISLEFFCGFKPHSVFPAAAAGGKFIFS